MLLLGHYDSAGSVLQPTDIAIETVHHPGHVESLLAEL